MPVRVPWARCRVEPGCCRAHAPDVVPEFEGRCVAVPGGCWALSRCKGALWRRTVVVPDFSVIFICLFKVLHNARVGAHCLSDHGAGKVLGTGLGPGQKDLEPTYGCL